MYRKFLKRFFDILISFLALPFVLLAVLIFAPIIHFTDGGSVFYNAQRIGKNNKVFKMYKFRSMRMNAPDIRNADGTTYNSENDPRVTWIGKFMRKTSIDELPQFFNVLKGDMSLIGPRPNTRIGEFPEQETVYRTVRPGITGYSQAYYRNSASALETVNGDVYYSQNIGLSLDFKIIFKTVSIVLKRENVFRNSDDIQENQMKETAEEFSKETVEK